MDFLIKSFFLFLLRLVLALIGLVVVAVALPFSYEVPGTLKANGWYLRLLPPWAWAWSNDRDGAEGDDQRRWLDRDAIFTNAWLNRWWWLAIRNPFNNGTRSWQLFSIDLDEVCAHKYVGQFDVRDKFGYEGYQFVSAVSINPIARACEGLYYVRRWGSSDYGFVIQIGFKLYPRELKKPPTDEGRVSFTFELAPLKKIS